MNPIGASAAGQAMGNDEAPSAGTQVGVVTRTWRYPVKSMLGQPAQWVDLTPCGVSGDRRYAVRPHDSGKLGSGKTTAELEQVDGLFEFEARYGDDERLQIAFPDGRTADGDAPGIDELLSQALDRPLTLQRRDDGSHVDEGPLHLLTTASLRWLARTLPGAEADERRFRPNVVIEADGDTPVEQAWVGATLRIGAEVELRVTEPTVRCRMVTLAQSELHRDPKILKHLRQETDLEFGIYAEVIAAGRVRPGDPVVISTGRA